MLQVLALCFTLIGTQEHLPIWKEVLLEVKRFECILAGNLQAFTMCSWPVMFKTLWNAAIFLEMWFPVTK